MRISPVSSVFAFVVLMGLSLFGPARVASANTITVNTPADENGAGAGCALREAITAANTNAAFGGCPAGSGPDTIILPAGTYTLTRSGTDNTNINGDLDIASPLTLSGAGAASTVIKANSSPMTDRVIEVVSGVVVISDVSLTGGTVASTDGAGILVNVGAAATLNNLIISGNTAGGFGSAGGGIANNGVLTVSNSIVENNRVTGFLSGGGGIAQQAGTLVLNSTAVLTNSTNSGDGGGLFIASNATATLVNNTFRGNVAVGDGGAIRNNNGNSVSVRNNTIVSNTATGLGSQGGAIRNGTGNVVFTNTLVLSNTANTGPNCNGTITNGGNNMQFPGTGCTGFIAADPLVAPLGNYGGATPSMALLPGSPAINTANATYCPATDQRGVARPQGAVCDIGAFESRGFSLTIGSGNNQAATINTSFAAPLMVNVTSAFDEPVGPGGLISFSGPSSGAGITPTVETTAATTAAGTVSRTVTANGVVGSYLVTVTTAGAATLVAFSLSNIDVAIVGLAAQNNSPKTLGSLVNLTATITSGTGVSYAWNFGDGATATGATATHIYAAAGVYTTLVTATNNANSQTTTTSVTISDVPIFGLSALNNSPTQLGSVTSLSASVLAGSNVSYTWNFGDGNVMGTGANTTHTYVAVGTYMAMVTATNGAGATSTATLVTIVDMPISGLRANNSSPSRLTDPTTFTASLSAGSNVFYVWNFGDGSSTVSGANTTHTYLLVGSFVATVTATNGVGSVAATTAVTITNLPPVADAGNDQIVSIVGNVNLIGVDSSDPDNHTPLSYLWQQTGGPAVSLSNPAAASPTFTAPNTASVLTFTLRVTDSQGLGSLNIDVVKISVIDIGISGLAAQNSSPTRLTDVTYFTVSITAGSGVAYTWDFGDGSPTVAGALASHVYAVADNYSVVVTATNGNGSVSANTVGTIVNLAPVADAGNDAQSFVGTPVALGGGASIDPDGHNPLSYLWKQTGGLMVTLSNANAISPTFTAPPVPAVLTFTLWVTDAQGLADPTPDEVIVEVRDVPVAGLITQSSSPTTLGQLTVFTASVSSGTNMAYAWSFGDGSSVITGATVSHVYASAGLFTATVAASNGSGGAFGNIEVTVVNLPPVADAGADLSGLVGTSISLNGGTSSDPDGHTPLSYAWQQTGGLTVSLSNAHAVSPTFTTPSAAGVLTFSLSVTDARGLADPTPDEVVVTVLDLPIAGLSATNNSSTTLGQPTQLTASVSSGTGVVFTWNFGDGSPIASGATMSHVYASAGVFTTVVTASNTSSLAVADTLVTIVNLEPVAHTGADQIVAVSGSVLLDGTASGDVDGHDPLSFGWVQTGGPTVSLSNPTDVTPNFVAPSVPSVLTFTLNVTDARGLTDPTPDEVVVRVVDIGISGLATRNSGPTPLGQTTTFTVTATSGSNVVYTWDFGDGKTMRLAPSRGDATTSHTYVAVGSYTAVVTATNAQGAVTAQTIATVSKRTSVGVYLPLVMK